MISLGLYTAGYSFFDSGDIELLGHRKKAPYSNVDEYQDGVDLHGRDANGSIRKNPAAGRL